MADMKQIHNFAVKWRDKFRDQNINYIELVDHWMADDCAALGFEMDCGPGQNTFSVLGWGSPPKILPVIGSLVTHHQVQPDSC